MFNIPDTPETLENKTLADLQRESENANPFLKLSWMAAQGKACARRVFELYQSLKLILKEAIPITAVQNLTMWASFWGITQNAATKATGLIVANGTVATAIIAGKQLTSSDGNLYETVGSVSVTTKLITLDSLTATGKVAKATLPSTQSLYDNQEVTITLATQTEYNGTFPITVLNDTQFTYVMSAVPPLSPATGTPKAGWNSAVCTIESLETGEDKNLAASTKLTFTTPITNINNDAYVDYNRISGGTDLEGLPSLKTRFIYRVQNPPTLFNVGAITKKCMEVSGVKKVFVQRNSKAGVEGNVGYVTVYFVRDGDGTDQIPTEGDPSQCKTVYDKLLEIYPAFMAEEYSESATPSNDSQLFVFAPDPQTIPFTFTALDPNTTTMQEAITANLLALFKDDFIIGNGLTNAEYIAAIQNTVDTTNGARVISFTLSTPTGDIATGAGEYPILGTVTYPVI